MIPLNDTPNKMGTPNDYPTHFDDKIILSGMPISTITQKV